ncbi:MAG: preprotein translocase subunit SecY [Nanoarchaeota archaeon]|nr:preprotein translocase subunit SecY [Nanoarchaeota archaeon]
MSFKDILHNLPEVKHPVEKKLSFNVKLKWTLIILVSFFILANISLYGLAANSLARFEYLAIILGTDFGSIISLGIGPIVMSSIILQLLVGAGLLNIDTNTEAGKKLFQGIQKIGVYIFIVFEAMVYVLMGGLQASPGLAGIVIFQLILGGLTIMLMDEVSTKWGFGSGVSLFILAGVSWRLFAGLFQFIGPTGENCLVDFSNTPCAGKILVIIQSLINGAPRELLLALLTIVVTAIIFLMVVWAQSLKVEIPLSYDRMRGFNIKWPLAFFYASVLPVILVAALLANIQLFGTLLENWLTHPTILGGFSNGVPVSGLAYWLSSSNLVEGIVRGSLQTSQIFQFFTYLLFFVVFSAVFAVFWVKTASMDEASQAKKIMASGLQIPGFRKDQRVLESILGRYILPLTIMGGLAIGLLAAITDSLGALTSGTAILLAIMIAYQFYQNIAQQHAVDMHPAMRNFMQ